ncbi:MAG: hypothetical protein AABX73_02500, partial [Nanoarchaeota archaeon]
MTKTATQFKAYGGRNINQMPLMLAQGVVPFSVAGFMRNRYGIMGQFGDIYADTSDLVAYGGRKDSDQVKMILTVDNQGQITDNGRKVLELINPAQERSSGAIVLSDALYDRFNDSSVISLSRKDLKKYGLNGNLTEAQVLNHPGWRVLLRHPDAVPDEFAEDKGFMQEAVGRTFAEMNKRHGYTEGMGFYLDKSEKSAKLRAWVVDGLVGRSYARGWCNLVNVDGRFVGIAPEAPSAPVEAKPETSQTVIKSYTPADLLAFDVAMTGLEGIVRSDVLRPFAN